MLIILPEEIEVEMLYKCDTTSIDNANYTRLTCVLSLIL